MPGLEHPAGLATRGDELLIAVSKRLVAALRTNDLGARYGGGKFKMNLHHGLHFVNTKNFKPDGEPRWKEVPEFALE